jgi:NDP-sugar pyrophosphorylase family protein
MNLFDQSLFFSLENFPHRALWREGASAWDALKNLKEYLLSQELGRIESFIPPSAYLIHPELITIGEGCIIEPGAYISGPCIIGPGSQVRHGAYIRGDLITGRECVIGHDTEVKHSILLNRVFASHFNYVGDSILGNGVNLGAGVKCANFRLDRENVAITFQGQRIETELKKFGAILGDGVRLGCNCVTNPGTLLGKGVICYPCLNIGGYVAGNSKIKPSERAMMIE